MALCVLCPWPDGALKQTTDRRWVHSVCAHWSAECHVLNAIYQEPIDISRIDRARFGNLRCMLCRGRGDGAPVQCSFATCTTAFHPMCARAAGWTLDYGKREAFCNRHSTVTATNEDEIIDVEGMADSAPKTSSKKRLSSSRKPQFLQSVTIGPTSPLHQVRKSTHKPLRPLIPALVLDELLLTLDDKDVLARIARYWALKRQSRRSMPLLKSLQEQSLYRHSIASDDGLAEGMLREWDTRSYIQNDLVRLSELMHLVHLREKKFLVQLELSLQILLLADRWKDCK